MWLSFYHFCLLCLSLMYPIITIGSHVLDMTGLSIVISLIILLISVAVLVHKSRLQFVKFFYWLPIPLILTYLLGQYVSFVMLYQTIIPLTLTEWKIMLSPYGYHFHIIGIILALLVSLWLLLQKMPSRHERRLWINIIASSVSFMMIPLWVWLLMGDHLIGLPTTWPRGIETLRPDISRRSDYGPIYPIGLYIALLGLITFIVQRLGQHMKRPSGQWYMTIALIIIGIGLIWTFVNTPKYLVMQIWPMRRDVTTYLCFGVAAWFLQQYMIEQYRVSSLSTSSTSPES